MLLYNLKIKYNENVMEGQRNEKKYFGKMC